LLLLGVAVSAQAKEHQGWVYNGQTGFSRASFSGLDDSALASDSSIGYRWGDFGVELGHAWFGKFKQSTSNGTHTIDVRADFSGWNAGVNYNHDLSEKWALQLRAGLFRWDVDGSVDDNLLTAVKFSDSGNDWYAGASVSHTWRKRSSIGLGYTHYHAGDADIDVLGIQSEYRFGKNK
jgi:hypothetical protein